ncbi:MAG: BACON domain-containing protein [Clostridia bacterium]|nr:BACON domain-containing protein [Clostridia bacterium]
MYDERGCETNLTTCGQLIDLDRELIVGPESLDKNTLVRIGLEASYANPHDKLQHKCNCQPTYIGAWTYLEDIQKFFEGNGITYDYYKLRIESAPIEGGNCYCYGQASHEEGNFYEYEFRSNTDVRLDAVAKPGYKFVGWKEYHTNEIFSINPQWTFVIKKNMHIIGVFEKIEKLFNVITSCSPVNGGYILGNKQKYKENELATLTAVAADGYEFIRWEDGNGNIVSDAIQFTKVVTEDLEFIAIFKKKPIVQVPTVNYYTVSVEADDPKAITYEVEDSYQANTKVSIPIKANNKYQIVSVESDDANIVYNSETKQYEFTITKDTVIKVITEHYITIWAKIFGGHISWKRDNGEDTFHDAEKDGTVEIVDEVGRAIIIKGVPNEGLELKGFKTYNASNAIVKNEHLEEPYEYRIVLSENNDNYRYMFDFKEPELPLYDVSVQVNPFGKAEYKAPKLGVPDYTTGLITNSKVEDGTQIELYVNVIDDEYEIDNITIQVEGKEDEVAYGSMIGRPVHGNTIYVINLKKKDTNKTVTVKTTNGKVGFVVNGDVEGGTEAMSTEITKVVPKGTEISVVFNGDFVTIDGTNEKVNYDVKRWYSEATGNTIQDGLWALTNFVVNENVTIVVETELDDYLFLYMNGSPIPNNTITFEAAGGTKEVDVISNVDWEIE